MTLNKSRSPSIKTGQIQGFKIFTYDLVTAIEGEFNQYNGTGVKIFSTRYE